MVRIIPLILFVLIMVSGVFVVTAQQDSAQPPASRATHISDFVSIAPVVQSTRLQMPGSHTFQYLVEEGTAHDIGNTSFGNNFDFTGYIPHQGSSISGTLGLNHETTPGGVSMMDIEFDSAMGAWVITNSQAIDFSGVGGTARNCSGSVTPWETYVTCEEAVSGDGNGDGYNDIGWCAEIDPHTRALIDHPGDVDGGDKLWALGNLQHENLVVHPNERTAYTGRDHGTGYLYRFVADSARDLSAGKLYVFRSLTASTGEWVLLDNSTPAERNSSIAQAAAVGASVFSGIEDVEIGSDGMIYFAAKGDGRVYRFTDDDPLAGTTVSMFETYVGGQSYDIAHDGGTTAAAWGTGNDNMAFDDLGNLWVLQDGGRDYIWVVEAGHTQAAPKVKLFGISPMGSEPTGITFTPDFKYLFMSIQHPSLANGVTTQLDAFGIGRKFDKDVAIVIAVNGDLAVPTAINAAVGSAESAVRPIPIVLVAAVALTAIVLLRYAYRP